MDIPGKWLLYFVVVSPGDGTFKVWTKETCFSELLLQSKLGRGVEG